ncbi:MAG TPA: hypothetical protein PLC53_01895 [Bacilli bacterium]|nr:hypothetical protein [Bacilli bacterium]
MKVYVGHSKNINYIDELYKSIRDLDKNISDNFILPHEKSNKNKNNRDFYSNLDLFIAEVSEKGTGLGIELGFAYDSNVPIVCISKKGKKTSSSLKYITDEFYEYETIDELKELLIMIFNKYKR